MAGSRRRFHVAGHAITGEAEVVKLLHRLSSNELHQIFMTAKELGQARIILDDEQYTLHRNADHTFDLRPGAYGHVIF